MTLRDHFGLITNDLSATLNGFSWGTRQTRQALKTALACVLSVMLIYFLDLKEAYWAGISTLIMMQPNVAASIRKGWMRAGGACCGCFMAVVLTGFFLQLHFAYTLALFSLSVLGFYLGVTARNGYFWSYFVLNAVLISIVGMTQPDITVYITVHRGAAVTLGVLVSLLVNVVLFPDYAYEILKRDFEHHRMEVFQWIREIVRQYLECRYNPEQVGATYRKLIREARKIESLLQDASMETKLLKGDLGAMDALFKRLSRRIEDFYAFYGGLPYQSQGPAYQQEHRETMQGLVENLGRMSKSEGWSLGGRGHVAGDIKQDLDSLESEYNRILAQGRKEPYGVLDFLVFLELIYLLRRIVDDLTFHTREDSVSQVAAASKDSISFDDENTDLYRFDFLGSIRAIHIPSMKYAIKGALGIVCVFWFWFWAEIPGGGVNMSVAVFTVLQHDLMSTTHKGLLRFLGCLVGAATGYMFLWFQVESTWVLCISIFSVIFIFAYIWGGRPGSAYMGCQAGLCYLVATIHDLTAMTSLAPPTERLVGIFLGVLFIWTINMLVWPEDLLVKFSDNIRRAETKLAGIGEEIAARFQGNIHAKPVALDVTAMQSTLQTLLTQVELSAEDGLSVRNWLKQLRLLAEESEGMHAVDADTVEILVKLNPDFVPLLVETIFLVSLARSHEDFRYLFSRIGEREREFQQIIDRLHQGVITERSMAFKQRVAHTLIICKRLIYRLRTLTEARSRFPALFDNPGG